MQKPLFLKLIVVFVEQTVENYTYETGDRVVEDIQRLIG